MLNLVIIALAVSGITFTICVTSVFKSLRESVSELHPKLEELIHCPWCLSHYVMLVMLWIKNDEVNYYGGFINFILMYYAAITMSGLFHYVLLRTYDPIVAMLVRRDIEKLNKKQS